MPSTAFWVLGKQPMSKTKSIWGWGLEAINVQAKDPKVITLILHVS